MADFLFQIHSATRWLVVLISILALFWMTYGLLQKHPYDELSERIMTAFSALITLEWLIGIILFLTLATFSVGYRWEHAVTMTLALGISHLHRRWKNAPDNTRYRNGLILIVVVLVLVFIGIARLPQGWGG
jgi:hypothetical protein